MLLALIRLGLFGPIIVSGVLYIDPPIVESTDKQQIYGTDWVSDGSRCYKTISGSPSDGTNLCSSEDPNATLVLAPTSEEANKLSTLFSSEKVWVGLRFRNGTEWFWDNGSKGPDISTAFLPQLCTGVWKHGGMYDYDCYKTDGLVCQKDLNKSGLCDPDWDIFGSFCFKKLRNSGVSFSNARILCSNENAFVMMPQSQSEASEIASNLDLERGWVGLTDFDADHTYTWENGSNIHQSSLYFLSPSEPNKRYQDNICAYIQDGNFYNGECTTPERVICEINAIDRCNSQTNASTQISTPMESTSNEIQITTPSSAFMTNPTTLSKNSTQMEETSAEVITTVYTSAIKTTLTKWAKASTPNDVNTASGTTSTGTNRSADETVTTVDEPVIQYDNATIMPCTFLGPIISASDMKCIIQCTSQPSENDDSNVDARPINIPYKVDLKSLSSYRRRYKSADDPRMSSYYIGCVGIAVLVLSILFIIMLDCLPSA